MFLTIASLNTVHVLVSEVENTHLSALCPERVCMHARPEFGNCERKVFIIRKALYGLKSSGSAFREFLAEKSENIGFKSIICRSVYLSN